MTAPVNATFGTFVDGGNLALNDIVVGLRNGLNTRFSFQGEPGLYLPLAGGTMAGAIDMNGNIITGLPDPVSASDAVNKAYADSLVAGAPLTKVDDTNVTLTLGGTPATSLLEAVSLSLGWTGELSLSRGGTNASLTASANSLVYSTASALALLATANSGVLITSSGGVPSISSTLPTAVQGNITQLGVQSQALNMGGFQINNGLTPTLSTDFATKGYVDQTALNGTSVYAASAATLGTVTQSGAGVGATLTNAGAQATFALDSVNPPVGSNVLIKNTATGMTSANEGIYTVTSVGSGATNWVLTRATSYDTATEINNTGLILIQNGSTLQGTAWYNAATIVTVDTTAFSYSEFGNIIFPITLANGGTNASLTASNGGIFYSTATAGAILAGTATARQMLQSGASGAPAWSTTTYPATNAINTMMYASAANVLSVISPVNSAGLLTSGAGVPGWVAYTGTGAPVLNTLPNIISGFKDTNGNIWLGINPAASSVNYIQLQNAATGNVPSISFVGSDSNISGNIFTTGTGGINITGASNASNALSGQVGYYVSSNVAAASGITLVANTATNITSISLPAGDFDVVGNLDFQPTGIIETLLGWVSTSSATLPDPSVLIRTLTAAAANGIGFTVPMLRVNSSTPITVYLSAQSSSTPKVSGTIQARCRR